MRSSSPSIAHSTLGYLGSMLSGMKTILFSMRATLPYLLGRGEQQRQVTEQYPDPVSSRSAEDLPKKSRGLLYNDIDKCTGCGECVQTCPTQAITMLAEPGATADKRWVSVFDIDYGRCIFCGLCVESCGPASLDHTRKFELAGGSRAALVQSFGSGEVTDGQRKKWLKLREMEEEDF